MTCEPNQTARPQAACLATAVEGVAHVATNLRTVAASIADALGTVACGLSAAHARLDAPRAALREAELQRSIVLEILESGDLDLIEELHARLLDDREDRLLMNRAAA